MKYTTIQGDTFDTIAKLKLGSELLADKLMQTNPALLDYVVFPAGITVTIPQIEQVNVNYNKLPTWRRKL